MEEYGTIYYGTTCDGSDAKPLKMHFVNGERLWCYETYKEVEAMLNAELK